VLDDLNDNTLPEIARKFLDCENYAVVSYIINCNFGHFYKSKTLG